MIVVFFLFFFRSSSRKLKAFQIFVGVNSQYFSGDVCCLKHFAINSPCLAIAIYFFFTFLASLKSSALR